MDMNMTNNVPNWLTPIAWAFIAAAVLSAVLIAVDIFVRGHRRDTIATEIVWVCSGLYLGPVALWLYAKNSRAHSRTHDETAPSSAASPATESPRVSRRLSIQ